MAIPSRYREDIESQCAGELVLTYSPFNNESLFLYPFDVWESIRDRVLARNPFDRNNQILQRRLVGSATQIMPDDNGRIQIPLQLRQMTGLEKKVVLMGLGTRFEIWNEAARDRARLDEKLEGPCDDLGDLII